MLWQSPGGTSPALRSRVAGTCDSRIRRSRTPAGRPGWLRIPQPNARALSSHPTMFQMGPIRSINPTSSPAAVLTGNAFHSEGAGVASTFTRPAAASLYAIRSFIRALVRWRLCPRRYSLERLCRPLLVSPHIHHHIIDHKRIDAGTRTALATRHFKGTPKGLRSQDWNRRSRLSESAGPGCGRPNDRGSPRCPGHQPDGS
jgi:hypothetical protein